MQIIALCFAIAVLVLRDQRGEGFKHVERQLQPVHFLGVNREVEIGLGHRLAQAPDAWHQLSCRRYCTHPLQSSAPLIVPANG